MQQYVYLQLRNTLYAAACMYLPTRLDTLF